MSVPGVTRVRLEIYVPDEEVDEVVGSLNSWWYGDDSNAYDLTGAGTPVTLATEYPLSKKNAQELAEWLAGIRCDDEDDEDEDEDEDEDD